MTTLSKAFTVCGVFFLFLIFYALYLPLPSQKVPIRMYSNHARDDLRRVCVKALTQAKHSIWIHTFALTDEAILSLLKQKAKEGVDVHVFYHKKSTPKLHKLAQENLHFHPIQEKGLMHSKWVIIDQTTTLLGTANLTLSSLVMHDNFLLGLRSPSLAAALQQGTLYHHDVIDGQQIDFYLLPRQQALDALLTKLDQAKRTITLALFTFTHPAIVKKLIELHKRHVHIELYLDAYTAQGASKGIVKQLQEAGISISLSRGYPLFHHKWAMIDSHTLILGSANWTRAAFEKNHDFILFLSPMSSAQLKDLRKIIDVIRKDYGSSKN